MNKVHFSISTFSQFTYDTRKTGFVEASQFIDGAYKHTFRLQQPGKHIGMMPSDVAYPLGKVPIKSKKMEDIRKCTAFVEEKYQEFYSSILLWPTTTA